MKVFLLVVLISGLMVAVTAMPGSAAQDQNSRIFVNVVLVQLNVAVTDRKGNYVTGLRPENFVVTEDKIQEKIASFDEGGAREGMEKGEPAPEVAGGPAAGN